MALDWNIRNAKSCTEYPLWLNQYMVWKSKRTVFIGDMLYKMAGWEGLKRAMLNNGVAEHFIVIHRFAGASFI
jgi:hypothetical protein